ncbi:MAG: hypothetical protein ABI835_17425 [Chloroflexota bacterium]
MDTDYSKSAFLKFLDFASEKGLVKFETVRTWRVSASKLLTDLSEAEEGDVRLIDVDISARKVANRNPNDLSPSSLNTYKNRVGLAIKEFVAWRDDPTGYKPRGITTKERPKFAKSANGRSDTGNQSQTRRQEAEFQEKNTEISTREVPVTSGGLPLSFPLRPDFLAQIVIPRDLTVEEAKRLGAFLLTIGVDYKPS